MLLIFILIKLKWIQCNLLYNEQNNPEFFSIQYNKKKTRQYFILSLLTIQKDTYVKSAAIRACTHVSSNNPMLFLKLTAVISVGPVLFREPALGVGIWLPRTISHIAP